MNPNNLQPNADHSQFKQRSLRAHLTENWPTVLLLAMLMLLFVLFVGNRFYRSAVAHKKYVASSFAGRIDTIYRYDKNWPAVSLSGRPMTIPKGSGFSTYLSVGDSITKAANTEVLVTYRAVPGISGRRMQVSVWGDDPNNKLGYWGLTDRYYIQDGLVQDKLIKY